MQRYFDAHASEGTLVYWQKHSAGKNAASTKTGPGLRASSYKVRPGDTLSQLALNRGVSLSELRRYNKLKSDKIRVGQLIRFPPGE